MNLKRYHIIVISFLLAAISTYANEITFITPQEMDLGEVESGRVIKGVIQFVNSGKDTVTISQVRTSCGCTAAEVQQKNYAPGDTAAINFQVNTRGFKGKVHKSITIEFEKHDPSPQSVQLLLYCLDYLEYSPIYLTFTQIHVNQDTVINRDIAITNHYKKPVKIKSISTDLDVLKLHMKKRTIEPNETVRLEVSLKPLRPVRQASDLIITTDQPSIEPIHISAYVYVQE